MTALAGRRWAERPASPVIASRWSHPIAVGVAVLALLGFAYFLFTQVTDPYFAPLRGLDRSTYHDAAERVLLGGSWFYPEQLTGQPYEVLAGHVLYPPTALVWLIPAAFLPDVLWWAIPLAIVATVVFHHRPSPWGWAAIAGCLVYPATSQLIVAGNPGLWIAAAMAVATVWRPAAAFILLKPSLFLFALFGARHRGWLVIVAVGALVSLMTLPAQIEWIGVVVNARGPSSGPLYSLRDVGLMLIPLIAYLARGVGSDVSLVAPAVATAGLDARS
jgi:hypothetical protein